MKVLQCLLLILLGVAQLLDEVTLQLLKLLNFRLLILKFLPLIILRLLKLPRDLVHQLLLRLTFKLKELTL